MSDRLEGAIRELASAIREEIAVASKPDSPVLLLGVDEAAHRLGISRTTLYGELAAGRVRSLKVGGPRSNMGSAGNSFRAHDDLADGYGCARYADAAS